MSEDERELGERSRRLLRDVDAACALLVEATGDESWLDDVHRVLMSHDARGLRLLLDGLDDPSRPTLAKTPESESLANLEARMREDATFLARALEDRQDM